MSRASDGFRRQRGRVISGLNGREAEVLLKLIDQLPAVLATGRDDPAVARLLPDAYRDDVGAADEFRSMTEQGLVDGKLRNARALADFLQSERAELSDEEAVQAVRTLTDLRLVLAERIGITRDDEVGDPSSGLIGIYGWLGYLQETLVRAIDA